MGRGGWRIAWLAPLLAASACARSEGAALLPARPQTVDVVMREYRFDYTPPASAGRVVFNVRNGGRLHHDLVLVLLPEDVPPLAEQLRGSDRRVVATIASVPDRAPGQRATFATDLAPGRYGLICFVKDADGVQHAQKGMSSEFRVG